MNQPSPRDVLHSLELIKKVMSDAAVTSTGKCGGDCANCPCSEESPKSTKKVGDQEMSDPCDKC